MNQTVKQALIIGLFFIASFIAWFVWDGFIRDKTPQFFPFNELQEDYNTDKSLDTGIFMTKYKGPNSFTGLNQENVGSISVMIGRNNYHLNQYLGKKVLLTKGYFKSGFTKPCVASKCVDMGGPYAAVVIDEMAEIQEAKPRDKVIEYVVENKITLKGIAEKIGILSSTTKWAINLLSEAGKQGQTLRISPVTGIMHTFSKGRTIYSIAKKYQINAKKIINFLYNSFGDDKYTFISGQTHMVPSGIKINMQRI